MDSLKHIVAARLKAQAPGQLHPDADALSAFAEKALGPDERQTILEHVGVCADCRAILFLAAPLHADTQQIFAVKKSWVPFAMRWGAVAACVVMVAAVLERRELTRTPPVAELPKMQEAAPSPAPAAPSNAGATERYIAAEKAPAESDEKRDRLSANAPRLAMANRGHAEPKAITAQPQATFDFKKSGQVSVAQESAESMPEAQVKDLPNSGRDAGELTPLAPGNASAAGAIGGQPGGPVSSTAQFGNVNGLATQNVHQGSAYGTIADAAGAAVPNAKVSAIGPLGERTAVSDQAGKFFFDGLAAGAYSFKVTAPGFRPQLQEMAVLPNKPATTNFKLDAGSVTETVEVSGSALAVGNEPVATPAAEASGSGAGAAGKLATQEQQLAQLEVSDQAVAAQELKKQKSAESGRARYDKAASLAAPTSQWSLSSEGTVQRSGDSGKTWQAVAVGNGTMFRAIFAAGANVWAGGNAGALFHSADFGRHWTQVVPAATGEKLLANVTRIDFSDALNGTVTTANGQTWTTADGGQTWARK